VELSVSICLSVSISMFLCLYVYMSGSTGIEVKAGFLE
jgi:hypothetical protein